MPRDREKHDLTVTFTGLTKPQKLAIVDMLACWRFLGGVGSSRMVSFYADGDGDFHPVIKVDGENPKHYGTPEEVEARWKPDHHGTYTIDYDEIAGRLRQQKDMEAYALGPAESPVPHMYRTRTDFPNDGCGFMGDHRFCLREKDDPLHNRELATKMSTLACEDPPAAPGKDAGPCHPEGCAACAQECYLNNPTTELEAAQSSVLVHTCAVRVPRPHLPGDLLPIPMNTNGGICECKHRQHSGECGVLLDEDPLPAGGTSKTYCRCKVFRPATLVGNLCLYEDCDSNHICFQVRGHKGPCSPFHL